MKKCLLKKLPILAVIGLALVVSACDGVSERDLVGVWDTEDFGVVELRRNGAATIHELGEIRWVLNNNRLTLDLGWLGQHTFDVELSERGRVLTLSEDGEVQEVWRRR